MSTEFQWGWESHGNGNKTPTWKWEWKGMKVDCMGIGREWECKNPFQVISFHFAPTINNHKQFTLSWAERLQSTDNCQ